MSVGKLDPACTTEQREHLLDRLGARWRVTDHELRDDGLLSVYMERTAAGGPDGEGILWVRYERIDPQGKVVHMEEADI